ncbi:MAG: glycosyltransferase family 2 protein, partial [bacterium]
MSSLSVIIIAKNEEHNIKDCIESVQWADEIIVIV